MSRTCDVCGRGPSTAFNRSHSNVATKRKVYLNLQTKKVDGGKIKACTKCLKQISNCV